MKSPLLQLQNLDVGYTGKTVVHKLSLTVERGEIVALVGESGSGKSTVLKAVMGLPSSGICITCGSVIFNGVDMAERSFEERRKLLGEELCMVFQDPETSMNPIRKIGQQFLDTLRSHRNIGSKEGLALIQTVFAKVGLQDGGRLLNSCPFELSGGMCQRVVLALAMVMKPALILADEPTSALDVMSQRQVMDELLLLRKMYGVSVLLVTHNIALASQIADRTVIMHAGRIVECGITKQVLTIPQSGYTKKLKADVPRMRAKQPVKSLGTTLFEARKVTKRYTTGQSICNAVLDVGLTISQGEILGIVGESGSGKSTLARLLLQLEPPDVGTFRFAGQNITQLSRKKLPAFYRRAQMVFQVPVSSFDSHKKIRVTLRDTVRNFTSLQGKENVDSLIDNLMHRVGLPVALADRYPWELSGGQCQRVAIARALVSKPDLLICDEATSALDVSTQAQIVELLRVLVRQSGMSMIFISHDIALVSNLCDSILVMEKGRCVEYGSASKVISKPENNYTRALLSAATIF